MMVVFSTTGGITGAEVGVAGGTAVLAQRVLEAVFGEDAVRRLAKRAKQDLDARVEALLAGELARYEAALDEVGVRAEVADAIRAAVAGVNDVRRGDDRLTAPSTAELEAAPGTARQLPGRPDAAAATADRAAEEDIVDAELVADEDGGRA